MKLNLERYFRVQLKFSYFVEGSRARRSRGESSYRDLRVLLIRSEEVTWCCLFACCFHAFTSIQNCKGKEHLQLLCTTYYYLSFLCQIIWVLSLVLVLLAEVSRLISLQSYVKIVAADTSYSLMRASLDRR